MTEKACDIQGWHYPHRWEVEWGYAGHGGYREEFQCPGVESLPLDPVSEAELICGDYPAPCNHNPAHKKGAE